MVTSIKSSSVKEALEKAREEVKEESQKKMVKAFKDKLRDVENAEAVLRNMKRELEELEYELDNL